MPMSNEMQDTCLIFFFFLNYIPCELWHRLCSEVQSLSCGLLASGLEGNEMPMKVACSR